MTTAYPIGAGDGLIIPRIHSPLRTLATAMTIMCYLACLAIGGLLLIHAAVNTWTASIAGEVTIQIQPAKDPGALGEVAKAAAILQQTPGVSAVDIVSRERGAELLEPWLGDAALISELPVPRLIAVTIDPDRPPDLARLEMRLKAEVAGVSVDGHQRWRDELISTARMLTWIGMAVLILIAGSTVVLVVHATSNALDANREIIEVLYLIGAQDRFISRQVERRLLSAALRAGLIGMSAGIATFALAALIGPLAAPDGFSSASQMLLFGPPDVTYTNYLMMALVPVTCTAICLITARSAVHRILRQSY